MFMQGLTKLRVNLESNSCLCVSTIGGAAVLICFTVTTVSKIFSNLHGRYKRICENWLLQIDWYLLANVNKFDAIGKQGKHIW